MDATVNFLRTSALVSLTFVIAVALFLEPIQEGIIHDRMRRQSQIVHSPNPGITIHEPENLGNFGGQFVISFENWNYKPDRATNPVTAFANGYQEKNTGHAHGWVFNEAGEQIRFYGAAGTTFDGTFYVKPDEFPPGKYVAYFQLQNHDHTPSIQANAPAFPSIQSVTFFVADNGQSGNPPNVPNCGCGEQVCKSNQ